MQSIRPSKDPQIFPGHRQRSPPLSQGLIYITTARKRCAKHDLNIKIRQNKSLLSQCAVPEYHKHHFQN